MPTLKEISSLLNELLQIDRFPDLAPNGLQVDAPEKEISVVATAVTANLATIEKAVEEKASLLIVHHGLFWNKDPLPVTGTKRKKLKLLFDHDIALLAYHFPLDAHADLGNNYVAAREMGWENIEDFGPPCGNRLIGVKGSFPSISPEAFRQKLEDYYQHPAHAVFGGKSSIRSAALISGGAHREILRAVEAGVDCFITGSFDEPVWHIALEEKIHFFAMGHAHTEKAGPRALGNYLEKKFRIVHKFLDIPNPF